MEDSRKHRTNIPRCMKNSDYLERTGFGIVNDQIVTKRWQKPEPNRKGSQVAAYHADQRILGDSLARIEQSRFHPVGRLNAIFGNEAPDFKKVGLRLRREPVTPHRFGCSASQARFRSSSRRPTSSASINSPRWAVAYPSSIFAAISDRWLAS